MSRWTPKSVNVVVLALAFLCVVPSIVLGQSASDTWQVPRTSFGAPDLQGVWANNTATPMERPAAFEGKDSLTEEELATLQQAAAAARDDEQAGNLLGPLLLARLLDPDNEALEFDAGTGNYNSFWLVERELDNRTSLIVDPPNGRVPPMTEEAKQRQRTITRENGAAGAEELPLSVRCMTYGVPNLLAGYNSYFQIFQTENHVVILQELIHDARVIPIGDQPHLEDKIRQWHGDSRAHYDGDTLVVETTNYSKAGSYRGVGENVHVTERFSRIDDENLAYEVTFTDSTTWTSPWTLMIPLKRSDGAIFEYACHEGNYGLVGMLAGARLEERESE